MGAYYVQTHSLNMAIFLLSLPPGLLSSAILIANNLRDETTDRKAGKNTLVVRFGRAFGKWEYSLSILFASFIPLIVYKAPLCSIMTLFAAAPLIKQCYRAKTAQEFIPLLPKTSLLLIIYTLLFCYASL